MSPQLLWTIAGLVLTILTLGGVTISSYQSMDGSTAKLIASETGNIATATKLWIGSKSTDNTFNGITAETVGSLIPDLKVTGTGAASRLGSKAATAVNYGVASSSPYSTVAITVTGMTAVQTTMVEAALAGKACAVTNANATSSIYTCRI